MDDDAHSPHHVNESQNDNMLTQEEMPNEGTQACCMMIAAANVGKNKDDLEGRRRAYVQEEDEQDEDFVLNFVYLHVSPAASAEVVLHVLIEQRCSHKDALKYSSSKDYVSDSYFLARCFFPRDVGVAKSFQNYG